VLAASTPADCFTIAIEAFRIATEFMTPVIILTDGYLANGAEPWRIPDANTLPKFEIRHPKSGEPFTPYLRDERLVRKWAIPGTPGLEHRIGGLEKSEGAGEVCYDALNHDHMVRTRRQKIDNIADTIPPLEVHGPESGELLVLGWGSTYGAITSAVEQGRAKGYSVSSAHLRYIDPMPRNTQQVLTRFKRVLVPEMNLGQLCTRIRALYLIDAISFSKVQGKPFMVREIESKIEELLSNGKMS
jgi:2-oxoglutarate ferredoxin oxidoreductase subunit alpha